MLEFEDFFKFSDNFLRLTDIELDPKPPTNKREIIRERLRKVLFSLSWMDMISSYILTLIYSIENIHNLDESGPTIANFFALTISMFKINHLILYRNEVIGLMKKLKVVFHVSCFKYYTRYEKNLRINNIVHKIYIVGIYVSGIIFFIVPIVQNVVAIVNGADHWEHISPHKIYIPFDIEPLLNYIIFYLWLCTMIPFGGAYMLSSEMHFNTLALIVSIEFDNLADEFGRFDYKRDSKEQFRKLVERHNELLALVDELNMIYRVPIFVTFIISTFLLCFSLLQLSVRTANIATLSGMEIFDFIKFVGYHNNVLLQTFMTCYFCERLRSASENIAKNLTNSNWYEATDASSAKHMQLVLIKAQQPVELQVYVFFGMKMEIFKDVLSKAHSYFSCLNSIH